jgi:hypothetical protein
VSKLLPRVSIEAGPENGACHVNQTVLPLALGSGTGSPVSRVASTFEPSIVPVVPLSGCADENESFAGTPDAAPASARHAATATASATTDRRRPACRNHRPDPPSNTTPPRAEDERTIAGERRRRHVATRTRIVSGAEAAGVLTRRDDAEYARPA